MMELHLTNITKSYGPLPVLDHVTMALRQDTCYCLMGPSGSGKTTLLRILMGLELPDEGSITVGEFSVINAAAAGAPLTAPSTPSPAFSSLKISAVFQEDRLCPSFSPLENVMLAAGSNASLSFIRQEMAKLLPEECLTRPVSTLSGGMKRRTAILRALLSPSHILLMDEPFTGLDEATKQTVITYIHQKRENRFLLLTTHQPEEAALLNAQIIHFAHQTPD